LSCLLFDLAIEPLSLALRKSTLRGFDIPNHPEMERLIATLFADDTTTYLDKSDNFTELQAILDRWCLASRAKFNINKTEVIPIGSETYRELVAETRRTNNDPSSEIPAGIRISKDGQAVRILGGWIGNKTKSAAPWAPILSSIEQSLDFWEKSHPTMEGRRLIIQMVVGGKTQYLTKVQGMPKEVEQKLERRIRRFLW
ncbi:hypothetical protein BDZ89DRAFT_898916, partial [Hymenopellis radicata]